MALALYRKYRPRTFAEVIGQEHVTEPLSQALRSGRLNHAYLFSGPRGCGKTSSARILARSLNCERGPTPEPCGECQSCRDLAPDGAGSIDVIEIDAASHGGVDDARDLRERAFFAPVSSRFKVYVIDEAHMVSSAGFNALLKLVEEPPEYVKFVFATTEPEKVLGTIKSRTHHYPFRLIPPGVLRPYLEQLTASEGVKVEPAVFPLVVRAGAGSARDSLSVLDQLIAGAGDEGVTYARAVALLGVTDVALIDEMCDALAAEDGRGAYGVIDRVVEAGHDPRRFASDLLERLRDLIVLQQVPDAVDKGLLDAPHDQLDRMGAQAAHLGQAALSRYADIVHNGLTEMRGTTAPRLLLELITARMLLPGADDSSSALLQRLERMERRLMAGGVPAAEPAPAAPAAVSAPGSGAAAAHAVASAAAMSATAPPAAAPPAPPAPGSGAAAAHAVASAAAMSATAPPAAAPPAPPAPASEAPAPAREGGNRGLDYIREGRGGGAATPVPEAPSAWSDAAPAADAPPAPDPAFAPAPVAGPATVPAAAPVVPAQGGTLDADAIRRIWPDLLAMINDRSKKAAAIVREATVQDVEGSTLVLGFKYSTHANMLNSSPDVLLGALQELVGGRWQVRCEVGGQPGGGGGGNRPAPPKPTPQPSGPAASGPSGPATSGLSGLATSGSSGPATPGSSGPASARPSVPAPSAAVSAAPAHSMAGPVASAAAGPGPGSGPAAVVEPVTSVLSATGPGPGMPGQRDGGPRAAVAEAAEEWPTPAVPGGRADSPPTRAAGVSDDDDGWPVAAVPGGGAGTAPPAAAVLQNATESGIGSAPNGAPFGGAEGGAAVNGSVHAGATTSAPGAAAAAGASASSGAPAAASGTAAPAQGGRARQGGSSAIERAREAASRAAASAANGSRRGGAGTATAPPATPGAPGAAGGSSGRPGAPGGPGGAGGRPGAPGGPGGSGGGRAGAAGGRSGGARSGPGGRAGAGMDSDWEGMAGDEPPYDPEYDSPVSDPRYPGLDPGDELLDDATEVRETSEEAALRLLVEAFGAEKIGEATG